MPPTDPKDGKRGQGFSLDRDSISRTSGKSWFFGVGINQYAHFSPLNNAVKDVKDLLILLQDQYGFDPKQTVTLFDEAATRDNIIDELDALVGKVGPEDKLLIYFSGHGHLNKASKLAYWIPQDARKSRTSGYIGNSTVRDYIKAIPSLHTLLISDSCFSGTLFVRGASRSDEAADELEQRRSRWGIVSGRHDEEVYDGEPGTNSPFAAGILKVLNRNRDAKLNVARLADRVIEMTRANYKQLPEGNPLFGVGHDGGQYVFRMAASESNLWERCRAEHSLAAYNDYLDQFPNGIHADEALQSIQELEEAIKWQSTVRIDQIYGYRSFLRSFPLGKYAAEARARIQLKVEAKGEEDSRHWDSTKAQDSKTAYSNYLGKYPHGQFASQARNRIKELEALERQAALEGKIEKAWQEAQEADTIAVFEAFIRQYPDHRFAKAAESRLQVKREEAHRKQTPERKVFSRQNITSEPITPEPAPESPLRKYLPYALGLLFLIVLAIWLPNWNGNENPSTPASFNLIPFESSDNRYGYKNEAGEVVIPAQYDYAYPFSENRAVVEKDSLHGIINRNGELLTTLKYRQIEAFSSGMAMVLLQGQYGFIDTTGAEVIAPQFKNAGSFDDTGEAWVQGDGKEFYIDKTGKCIRNCDEQKQVDTAPVTEQAVVDQDQNTWEKIKNTNDLQDLRDYLQQYSKGKYRKEAQQKIDNLEKEDRRQKAAQAEDKAWNAASRENTIAAFDDYLNSYPQGKYASKARQFKKNLEDDARKKAAATVTFPRKSSVTLKGKTYATIQFKANGLTWMAQNLDHEVPDSWYHSEVKSSDRSKYGRLYNWEAAKKACQAVGWRLPTDSEWKNLAQSFGGYYDWETSKDIGDPKKAYTSLLDGGSSGLSAQLGGYRGSYGRFDSLGSSGYYWSATGNGSDCAWLYTFYRNYGKLGRYGNSRAFGRSCRCVQD